MRLLPLAAAAAVAVMGASALFSCKEKERNMVANVTDGESTPTMSTSNVETMISDSGYTRYHISTPEWLMFDNAQEPFWRFPIGLELEQYDLEMQPSARMECDSALYFSRKRLWRLDGDVMMVNTLNDSFMSQQLFWDQTKRKVFTDSFIHIVRSDRIIEGYGFESNENMTAYTINRPTAILPVKRRTASGGEAGAEEVGAPADSLAAETPAKRSARPRPVRQERTEPEASQNAESKHQRLRPDLNTPMQLQKAPTPKG